MIFPDGLGRQVSDPVARRAAYDQAVAEGQVWAITWPAERAQIEDALRPRVVSAMNWTPGTSVEDLQAENIKQGVI